MLIKKYTTTNTGNSVANHTEKYFVCDSCNGSGLKHITKEEVYKIMDTNPVKYACEVYSQWRNNDENIYCKDCDGIGTWTDCS